MPYVASIVDSIALMTRPGWRVKETEVIDAVLQNMQDLYRGTLLCAPIE